MYCSRLLALLTKVLQQNNLEEIDACGNDDRFLPISLPRNFGINSFDSLHFQDFDDSSLKMSDDNSYHNQRSNEDNRFTSEVENGYTKRIANSLKDGQYTETLKIEHKRNLPTKEELKHFVKRGRELNEEGFFPIHQACLKFPQSAKLIEIMLKVLPESSGFQVQSDFNDTINYPTQKKLLQRSSIKSKSSRNKRGLHSNSSSLCSLESSGAGSNFSNQEENPSFFNGMYPIHIAVVNSASIPLITILSQSNPRILSCPDAQGMVPLSHAFRWQCNESLKHESRQQFYEMVKILLSTNPKATKTHDARRMTPLHYACRSDALFPRSRKRQKSIFKRIRRDAGLSCDNSTEFEIPVINFNCSESSNNDDGESIELNILKKIIEANPDAIKFRNFHGETPLDLAERNENIDDEAITYMHKIAYGEEEIVEDISKYSVALKNRRFSHLLY